MSWSYNPSYLSGTAPVNQHAQVRLLIGDTVECDKKLEDEEITWVMSTEGNVWTAALACFDLMISKVSQQPAKSVGPLSRQDNQKVDGIKAAKAALSRRAFAHGAAVYAGGISRDDKKATRDDTDWDRPSFTRKFDAVPGPSGTEIDTSRVGGLV